MNKFFLIIVSVVLLGLIIFLGRDYKNEENTQIANPASVYCIKLGHTLDLRKDENTGGVSGFCVFPDGSECEEWSFFRGECGIQREGLKPECPEWVNCMPGPDVIKTCIIPPGCEGFTRKAY